MLEAMRAGAADIVAHVPVLSARAYAELEGAELLRTASSAHVQIHMHTHEGPFADARVRRALALALDRRDIIASVIAGYGQVGSDSPFGPTHPFTDQTVPERPLDIAAARSLLAEAGVGAGFTADLVTQSSAEMPALASALAKAADSIGIKLRTDTLSPPAYFADGVFGKSPWLDSPMGLTDFPHRGLPHLYLTAALGSSGAWNAAHYKSPAYDAALADYVKAIGLPAQQDAAGKIQRLLMDDTPVLIPYFADALTAVRQGITGIEANASGQIDFSKAAMPS